MNSTDFYSASLIIFVLYGLLLLYEDNSHPKDNLHSEYKPHSMGFRVENVNIHSMKQTEIDELKQLISEHGVIVISHALGTAISSEDLLSFAAAFGEPIKLPNGFGFNSSNAFESESYITNITNIDPFTGLIKKGVNTAEYLHNDGDFWQNHYIYTFLYGEVIPSIGGNTQFIDLAVAHDYLKTYHSTDIYDIIQNKNVVIDVNDIPDFAGSPFLHDFNQKYHVAKHKVIDIHPVTLQNVLYYACQFANIEGFDPKQSQTILNKIDQILLQNEWMGYKHEWNPNDLVIWDNRRVMHRSMGGYSTNPRKLWRVQSHLTL